MGLTSQSARRASAILQSDLSRPDEESDNDEENDPIVHSFGPFGDNLLPRLAAFRADESPIRSARPPRSLLPAQPLQPTLSPRQPAKAPENRENRETTPTKERSQQEEEGFERVRNHAVNQLAFSRLSSTPFSTILNNLPPSFWRSSASGSGPSRAEIRFILETTKCIGKVAREGKDAAGKPLESEFYYVPDDDDDDMRRETVVNNLRKPGLRNCRKQHKVCVTLSFVHGLVD
jgi:regulator of nonsense transcripts 2